MFSLSATLVFCLCFVQILKVEELIQHLFCMYPHLLFSPSLCLRYVAGKREKTVLPVQFLDNVEDDSISPEVLHPQV